MILGLPKERPAAIVPEKVFDVIDSCKNAEQLLAARRYTHLWIERQYYWDRPFLGQALTAYLMDKCNLLIVEGK